MPNINIFKKGVRSVDAVDTWVVSWYKRHGKYMDDEKKAYMAFTNKDDAMAFRDEIDRANALIGNTYHETATIEKQKAGL